MAGKTILMLLTNAYGPDPRVRQEAISLIGMGCRIRLLAWDRDLKAPTSERMEGIDVERVFVASTHGRGATQAFFYVRLYWKMFWRGIRIRFDAVHCHDLDTLPLGFVLTRLRRKPIVYDAHESFPDMLAGSVPSLYEGRNARISPPSHSDRSNSGSPRPAGARTGRRCACARAGRCG